MADAPAPAALPVETPANPAPPEAAPAPAAPRLTGRDALAVFQDLPAETPTDPKAPTAASSAPAEPAASPPATAGSTAASPAATDKPSDAAPADPGPRGSAFRALAEREAKFRREVQAFESLKTEAQQIVDWFKAVQADPSKLTERLGADIFERGAKIAAGVPPKPADPNDRVAAIEKRLDEERKQAEEHAIRAQVATAHQTVRGYLEKAGGDDVAAVLAFGKQNEVFDGFSLYLRQEGVQVHGGRYFARDGTPLAPDFEQQLVIAIGKEVNKSIVEEYGALVEKVPQFRSRFAPAPAAPAPAAATHAAPPQATTPPAREAPAPATLTSRHGNDAAPTVSNGRRKHPSEVDAEIASRFWGA